MLPSNFTKWHVVFILFMSLQTVVLITEGKFADPAAAEKAAVQIRTKLADLFVVAIGDKPDVDSLVKMVSLPTERNVFLASTPNALQANLRGLTDAICKGGSFCV